jgi:superfamily II DNA or RNA helicase
MLDLRPYQTEAIEAAEQAEREGTRRPLVVHPTGTGKTVTFSHALAQRAEQGRGIILVHREELALQAIEKMGMIAPELDCGLVKGDEGNEVGAPVVVASVPTVSRDNRLVQLIEAQAKYGAFGTVVADEAHHAPAPTWIKTLTALGSFNPYGPLTIGFTATPERDGKTLGVWEKVVSYMSIREAIFQGYLCPILPAEVVETGMNMGRVRKTGGDYSEGDLGEELEASGAIEQIADAYVEKARDRKAVAFTPTVKTAHSLAEALRARGVAAEALDGGTPTEERRAILKRLKTGQTQVVCNCGVLTEGFDEPSIRCVIVARPTKFHGLYVQMVGRGTRIYPGKENLLVLDVVGAAQRHELVSLVDLGLDLDDPRKKREEGEKQECPTCGTPECAAPEGHRCQLCHRYLPRRVVAEGENRHENCQVKAGGKLDVFGTSRLRWLPVEDCWVLGAGKEIVVMAPVGLDTWKLAAYENGRLKVLHPQIPADWARGIGEDRAKAFQKLVERDARWLSQPVSDLQKGRLIREGLPEAKLPLVRTRGDAADLLTRISGRRAVRKLVG